jgi:hypothetical protein
MAAIFPRGLEIALIGISVHGLRVVNEWNGGRLAVRHPTPTGHFRNSNSTTADRMSAISEAAITGNNEDSEVHEQVF